eukprot:11014685-Alexandrium_andersonii.AAC.1
MDWRRPYGLDDGFDVAAGSRAYAGFSMHPAHAMCCLAKVWDSCALLFNRSPDARAQTAVNRNRGVTFLDAIYP